MEKIGTYLKDLKNNTKALIINKINSNYYKILVFGQLNSNNPHIEIKIWADERLYNYWENVKNISPEEINKINKLLTLIVTNYEKANIINRPYQTITEDDETNIKNILNSNQKENINIQNDINKAQIGTILNNLSYNTKAIIINENDKYYYKLYIFHNLNSKKTTIEITNWGKDKLYNYWENYNNITTNEILTINKYLQLLITNKEKIQIIKQSNINISAEDETNIKNILNKNNNKGVQIKMENPNLQLNMLSTNASNKLDEVKENLNNINILINQLLEENENLKEEIKNNKNELNIGSIQALKIFKNIKDFITQIKNLYNVTSWGIYPGTYSDRATVIKKYSYYNELKDEFNEKNLTNKPIGEEQIISFFDTMYLMYKILSQITDEKIKQDMKIIMEYVIPEPSKPRIDYMLVYRNSILLLEFSKANSIETISNEQGQKLQQVNGYATLLKSNINNTKIDINVAVGMYLDESTDANIELTNRTIDDIKKKINKFFKKDELKNAFELLSELE